MGLNCAGPLTCLFCFFLLPSKHSWPICRFHKGEINQAEIRNCVFLFPMADSQLRIKTPSRGWKILFPIGGWSNLRKWKAGYSLKSYTRIFDCSEGGHLPLARITLFTLRLYSEMAWWLVAENMATLAWSSSGKKPARLLLLRETVLERGKSPEFLDWSPEYETYRTLKNVYIKSRFKYTKLQRRKY